MRLRKSCIGPAFSKARAPHEAKDLDLLMVFFPADLPVCAVLSEELLLLSLLLMLLMVLSIPSSVPFCSAFVPSSLLLAVAALTRNFAV
jgi:hypothetical protein